MKPLESPRQLNAARSAASAPIEQSDRLPDEKAVWRDPPAPTYAAAHRPISVDLGGVIERTTIGEASWLLVQRWRFGWPPRI